MNPLKFAFGVTSGKFLGFFVRHRNIEVDQSKIDALILGLEMAMNNKVHGLRVYGDTKLVINELLSTFEVRKPELLPYHDYTVKLAGWFPDITVSHIPRKENA
ncbi:hypothetical protein MLD38_022213 [Melastoma candidum]|uniref:Uncharacterized protein n=1 Tax=Melastoma candidum TaxID=119954 RepID=A0ACB9QIF7_9MYRT|nr:hypothetical protein MLD38_022213 [Melastoma candidum]